MDGGAIVLTTKSPATHTHITYWGWQHLKTTNNDVFVCFCAPKKQILPAEFAEVK
jgi:hypothetical protein